MARGYFATIAIIAFSTGATVITANDGTDAVVQTRNPKARIIFAIASGISFWTRTTVARAACLCFSTSSIIQARFGCAERFVVCLFLFWSGNNCV